MFFGLVILVGGFFESLLFILGIFIFILPYFYLYAKTVEESCMIREINTNQLTEGDWLYTNLKVGRKIIKATWDGLNKEQIRKIKKRYKKIKIRQGIPFTPVFLISFLILIVFFYLGYLDFLMNFLGIFI
jgi:hypothetical protein